MYCTAYSIDRLTVFSVIADADPNKAANHCLFEKRHVAPSVTNHILSYSMRISHTVHTNCQIHVIEKDMHILQ